MFVKDPMILELIALLKAYGVKRLVVSPGSRHYPLVRSLAADDYFQLYSVVDERSAGFFANGLATVDGNPVGMVTTSGTAAVNLSSAIADAFYQKLPIVAITADRFPQFLNQMEDQMIEQTALFQGMIRKQALLRPSLSKLDNWYNNRVINEALLAMTTKGSGPVHINLPILSHTGLTYSEKALPSARKINYHTNSFDTNEWEIVRNRLDGRKVWILWGQGRPIGKDLYEALDNFVNATDSVIISDHLANLHHPARMANPYGTLSTGTVRKIDVLPDIVITTRGTSLLMDQVKHVLNDVRFEHWKVGEDGELVDPFHKLSDIFQLSEDEFLLNAAPHVTKASKPRVRTRVAKLANSISEPIVGYGEALAIGTLMRSLPKGVALHIANSLPIRLAHFYALDESILVLGNRGVNGIDGSMSSTIGFASGSARTTFLMIGDLSFFYDMNSLGIENLPRNLRILVLNNGSGVLMRGTIPSNADEKQVQFISTRHNNSVKGWVRSLDIEYLSARNVEELEEGMKEFISDQSDRPVVFEVFTDPSTDIRQFEDSQRTNIRKGQSGYFKLRSRVGVVLKRAGLR